MSTNTTNLRRQPNFATMSGMSNMQRGFISLMLMSIILLSVFFVGAASFGIWAFVSRQDYKNNSDQKAEVASAKTKEVTEAADAAKYAEEVKNPLKTYVGPSQYGAVNILYPKTWSTYTVETNSSTPVSYYFHPDVVPDITNAGSAFSTRVQIVANSYDKVMGTFTSLVQNKKVTVAPFSLAKVPAVIGSRVEGQITGQKQGTMIVLPLRNLTLQIWTEGDQYKDDFEKIVLPNLTFSP